MWTRFMDMHSGGGTKENYSYIYIEAPEEEAKVIFYNRFGHSADRVSCTCCGEDYSTSEKETLEQITAYERHCAHVYFSPEGKEVSEAEAWVIRKGLKKGYREGYVERPNQFHAAVIPLDKYLKQEDVLVIYAKDIKPEEREGTVPDQGYVWVD